MINYDSNRQNTIKISITDQDKIKSIYHFMAFSADKGYTYLFIYYFRTETNSVKKMLALQNKILDYKKNNEIDIDECEPVIEFPSLTLLITLEEYYSNKNIQNVNEEIRIYFLNQKFKEGLKLTKVLKKDQQKIEFFIYLKKDPSKIFINSSNCL